MCIPEYGWWLADIWCYPKTGSIGTKRNRQYPTGIAHEMTKIEPAISLPIEIIDIPERPGYSVIAIHCEPAQFGDAPYTYDGRAFYKVESTTVQMPPLNL